MANVITKSNYKIFFVCFAYAIFSYGYSIIIIRWRTVLTTGATHVSNWPNIKTDTEYFEFVDPLNANVISLLFFEGL